MTESEELQEIVELMDEWRFVEDPEPLRFREWLAQTYPDKLEQAHRVLGPETSLAKDSPEREKRKKEIRAIKQLSDDWDASDPIERGTFFEWLRTTNPGMLEIAERHLGPDPHF